MNDRTASTPASQPAELLLSQAEVARAANIPDRRLAKLVGAKIAPDFTQGGKNLFRMATVEKFKRTLENES